jgi:hypothetical protein
LYIIYTMYSLIYMHSLYIYDHSNPEPRP